MSYIITFFAGTICGMLIMALVATGGDDDD